MTSHDRCYFVLEEGSLGMWRLNQTLSEVCHFSGSGPDSCLLTSPLGYLAAYFLRGTDKHVPSGSVRSLLITCTSLPWHFLCHRRLSLSVLGALSLLLLKVSLACQLLPVGPWTLHKIVCHPVLHPVTEPRISQKAGETLVKEGRKYLGICTLCGRPGLATCPSYSLEEYCSLYCEYFLMVNVVSSRDGELFFICSQSGH